VDREDAVGHSNAAAWEQNPTGRADASAARGRGVHPRTVVRAGVALSTRHALLRPAMAHHPPAWSQA
jgi:hypothetical protein